MLASKTRYLESSLPSNYYFFCDFIDSRLRASLVVAQGKKTKKNDAQQRSVSKPTSQSTMVTPLDLVRRSPRLGHVDEARVHNLHRLRREAHHSNLVQPPGFELSLPPPANTPRRRVRVRVPVQRQPRILELVLLDELVILIGNRVEITHNDSTNAAKLAQDAGELLELLGAVGEPVARVEVRVDD